MAGVSVRGTTPGGMTDEREVSSRVRQMFTRIAPRYDLLNHLLSFSFDRSWRRRTAKRMRHILTRRDARVLDLCCGTGDLAFQLHRVAGSGGARIIGSDLAHPMLTRALQKNPPAITFAEADALQLPFADATFDLSTNAFGFRNLANYEAGLREVHRVLKPGGTIAILEFAEPRFAPFRALYDFYFHQLVPRIGGAISGSREAYSYLPASVAKFPSPEDLRALMTRSGFRDPRTERWMFGSVCLHTGEKQFEAAADALPQQLGGSHPQQFASRRGA